MEKHFTAYIAKDWEAYQDVLVQTTPGVIQAFEGTDLAENVNQYYAMALPQNGEGFVDFVRRNHKKSYVPLSQRMEVLIDSRLTLVKFFYVCSRVPLLKKLGRVSAFTGELYLGQKQQGLYLVEERMGNSDEIKFRGNSLNQNLDLDIDVGLDGGLYLVRINTHRPQREVIGTRILDVFEDFFKQKNVPYERSETNLSI